MRRDQKDALDVPVYRALLESGPDAFIAINAEGTILYANSQADLLFGYDKEHLIGKSIEIIIPERLREYHIAHRRTFIADPLLRPMGTGMELSAVKKDGTEFPVEISLSPVDTPSGLIVAATVRDVSVRKKVEYALRKAKEDAEQATLTKSRFLAAASHDLRQPLQATQMYLTALSHLMQDNSGYELIHRMQLSTHSLSEILNALLDIARLDTGQIEPELSHFPILDLMQQVVADVTVQAKDKKLELKLVPTQKHVYSDKGLLGRILGNLVSNAVRHTDSGRVLIGCRGDGDHLLIQVWDTGPGIPPESQESIFEEYFKLGDPHRNRSRGLGLGLAIVSRLALILDHSINLESTLHRGSMFSVRVPLGAEAGASEVPLQETVATTDNGEIIRILFIEDDPDIVDATSLVLKLHGYDVYAARNSQEAVDQVTKNGLVPDIILSDYHLQGNETGVQIVQRVRTLLEREIPVVFMTGDISTAGIKETQMRNCAILHKPIEPRKLNSALLDGLISGAIDNIH